MQLLLILIYATSFSDVLYMGCTVYNGMLLLNYAVFVTIIVIIMARSNSKVAVLFASFIIILRKKPSVKRVRHGAAIIK